MAGHSKWANIRHRKGAADARRNKIFTKLMREIMIATKEGGSGDIDTNPRLRSAVLKARVENMPKDNIEKAIKKGLGENNGALYEEILYEAFINGIALMISVLSDNKNRSASDVRTVLTKAGGALATSGSVSRLFERKGIILLPVELGEDAVMEQVLELGAQDIQVEEDTIRVECAPRDFSTIVEAIQSRDWEIIKASVEFVPLLRERVSEEQAQKLLALVDRLEDLDEVQSVEHNMEMFCEEQG